MTHTRKSPVHASAAMLSQVHPSPAEWAVFEKDRRGKVRVVNVGQFTTSFHSDDNHCFTQLRATFRTTFVDPYFGVQDGRYTPDELGLMPCETITWLDAPPTDYDLARSGRQDCTRDERNPYVLWGNRFIVKMQNAHKVTGSRDALRTLLNEFYEGVMMAAADLFFREEEEKAEANAHS